MKRIKTFLIKIYVFVYRDILNTKPEFVLVMGHMRSGSSLLSHILISNSDIEGLGETNSIYTEELDFWKLTLKCRLKKPLTFFKSPVFLDQINHNEKLPNIDILKGVNVTIICLVREPNEAVFSLVKLSEEYYNASWDKERSEEYYLNRLEYLKELIENESISSELVTYEELTIKSDECLNRIGSYLGLSSPLKTEYETFKFTGVSGDPSKKIFQGKVVPKSRQVPENYINNLELIAQYEGLTSNYFDH